MPDDEQQQLRSVFEAKTSREKSERARALVDAAFGGVSKTRAKQRLARDFLRGRISANLPQAIKEAAIRHGSGTSNATLEYHAPQILTATMRLVAEMGSQEPQVKRHPVARARESGSVSYRIERVAKALTTVYPYRQSCDPLFLDSEAGSLILPATAHWAAPVDQYDYCTEEEWSKLPDDLKGLWAYEPAGASGSGGATRAGGYTNATERGRYRRYARKYRRDENGRAPWDDEYAHADRETAERRRFREDTRKSAEAVDEEIEQRMRAKIPLDLTLLLPPQFAPINPRWVGDVIQVDGIARRETFGGTDLYRSGYRWSKDGPTLVPNDAMNSIAPVTLDTLLLRDGDGCPYLIYSIDGCRTWRQDGDQDFHDLIDLNDRYGFDFLPAVYQIALHTMSDDWDDMVIPFLEPRVVPTLMRDRLVAMNDFHVQQTSCGGWFLEWSAEAAQAMGELARKPEFKIKQMAATPIPGRAVPAVHPGAGPGLLTQKDMLDMDLMLASPKGGGDEASSGIHEALLDRDEARGNNMAWSAIDGLFAGTISGGLRALACMARKLRQPIELTILTELPDDDSASSTRPTVVVDPDMFGGDYRVIAWRPGQWGSDPTKQAMMQEGIKNKLATRVAFLEEVGDPDPWGTLAEIFTEDLILNTPEGKDLVLDEQAKINKDLQAMERARMRREQLLNAENVPTGFGGGVADPNAALVSEQPGSAVPGVTLDATQAAGANPGTNQMNAVSGAPQAAVTNIANAGGDASGLDFGRGI